MLGAVADLTVILLAEDGRFVGVVLELEQVVGRIFQKKCAVLDARAWESNPRLLIESKPFGLCPIR